MNAMNNLETLRVGGHGVASPPLMRCYKPRMNQSDLVSNLEQYVSRSGMSGMAGYGATNTNR